MSEEDLPDDETRDESMETDEATQLERQSLAAEETADLEKLLRDVKRLPLDTKARELVKKLRQLAGAGYAQTIVFTQYTDTMEFLRDHLAKEELRVMCYFGDGGRFRRPDGSWERISREETKRRFREKKAEILLATDAAAEGLNFQFCGALVNYDMPWNPMRVEQRIGRIDRLGQEFPTIKIVNLHYKDTVETDVYMALRTRIRLFSSVVGKLQPILAALPQKLAQVMLASGDRRQSDRESLLSELDQDIAKREGDAFDLDAVAVADLDEPMRPDALYDLDALDALLKRSELLPPGMEVKRLAKREYEVSMPGMREPLRVTTQRELFEDQPETYELWSPGSPLFPWAGEVGGEMPEGSLRLRDLLRDR